MKLARECDTSEQKWRSKGIFCSDDTKNDPSNEQIMHQLSSAYNRGKKDYVQACHKGPLDLTKF